MKYLITGGAGFIGSHLCEELLSRGHEVTVIDNFLTGKRERVPREAHLIEADICNYNDIVPHFQAMDGVFHAAAYPRVPRSIKEPMLSHHINVTGTANVLEASAKSSVKRLIFSSSSTPYGEQATLPLHEGMRVRPMCPYAAQKIAGELYCDVYSQLYNLETVCLRYFGAYGKHMIMDDEYVMAIPAFIKARMDGTVVTIYGTGKVTRDFTHVDDIVRANILAMDSKRVGKAEIINVGAGNNISVNQLAQYIGVTARYVSARYEPQNTRADNAKARELLGWQPTIHFEDGIKNLLDFYFPKVNVEKVYEKILQVA